ncbi:esterase-like activity of phytase family protein [Pontixanthobacter luteolus]|uniref:esterase-like activity of phytase family protein n=1 Tax=Pontixanthobacter luteolus TaxID=295089 RepID=UPI0023034616|nr:esterase-like activity of phytase family protein [Pontixanthobacter luteolus]
MRRWFLIACVVLALAPGTWVRSPPRTDTRSQVVTANPLELGARRFGQLQLAGAWELTSPNSNFGSYSALLALDDGRLMAGSDTGKLLIMPAPGQSAARHDSEPGTVRIENFAGKTASKKKLVDIESLTRDSTTGRIWVGYEGINSLERLDADLTGSKLIRPAEMRRWPSNSGPEAMVRLRDGRFIVLSEGRAAWWSGDFPALLYGSDPVEGAVPEKFAFAAPEGFRPVDMAQLPDGRVLVLVRKLNIGLPPSFDVSVMLADPAEIRDAIAQRKPWSGEVLGTISGSDVQDNYEGLAIVPRADSQRNDKGVTLWLISDDNRSGFQRTLLLELHWDPA